MANDPIGKTIASVGLAEEDEALLRLLVRQATPGLVHRWAWGEEAAADLLVVDPSSPRGHAAGQRARDQGVACAVFGNLDAPFPHRMPRLRRPLDRAQVAALLGAADAAARERPAPSTPRPARRIRPHSLPGDSGNRAEPSPPSAGRTLHRLAEFLDGDLLDSPASIALSGLASLALDPKRRMFHARVPLGALDAYCRTPLRREDWIKLAPSELGLLRARQPAQPYMRLHWLDAWVHSNGRLARHLDPGGQFRLTRWLEIDGDYHGQSRIASTMMRPAYIDEIVAASGAPLTDVIAMINAYDAIGLIETAPLPRRTDPAPD